MNASLPGMVSWTKICGATSTLPDGATESTSDAAPPSTTTRWGTSSAGTTAGR